MKRIVAALGLCLAGAAVSGLLLLQHHGEPRAVSAVEQACGSGQTSGCDEVARSSWSRVAGLPVAAWGLVFYLSLALVLALAVVGPAELALPLALLAAAALVSGLLVDLVLLAVQAFSIHAFCRLCLLTYLLSALALVALLPARRASAGAAAAAARPEGRLALAGWALGTLALAVAVLALNMTLVQRAAQRQARLLGPPAPVDAPLTAGSPAPVPSASPGAATAAAEAPQDAAYWRERAQKLQATIDDPQKLEAYFSERAQREYDASTPVPIELANVPLRGPADAPVKVVEYSDFMCPFCRSLAVALQGFVPQAGGRVAVYFKNFPLDNTCNTKLPRVVHAGACTLALGAVCAHNQGKFEAYHDRVFGTEIHNPQPADVVRLAGEAGLNAAAIEGCLDDPTTKQTLAAQIAEASRLGVTSTPTVFINGKKLPRINDFVAVVDKEARKKGFAPLGR